MTLSPKIRLRIAALALCTTTFALFSPSIRCDFFPVDDPSYIHDNPIVKNGLSTRTFLQAWITPVEDHYTPLVTLSFLADTALFGPSPAGYHFTNTLLHALNALLLFLLLSRWNGQKSFALPLAATLLWAWHPLRVEAVAWCTARKDLLSTFFLLLSLSCYASGGSHPASPRYWTALALFLAGLLSKTTLVMTPLLLLLLDYYPPQPPPTPHPPAPRLLLEKFPFFLLALLAGLLLLHLNLSDAEPTPLLRRLAIIPSNYLFTLEKHFWPSHLSFLPFVPVHWSLPRFAAALLLGAPALATAFSLRHRHPHLLLGALWFLLFLLPIIGVANVGIYRGYADRFSYLPAIGLSLALLAAPPLPFLPHAVTAAAALCATLTLRQIPLWHGEAGCLRQLLQPVHPPPYSVRYATRLSLNARTPSVAVTFAQTQLARGIGDALPTVLFGFLSDGRPDDAAAAFTSFTGLPPDAFPFPASLPTSFAAELAATLALYWNARADWPRALPLWSRAFRLANDSKKFDKPWTQAIRPMLLAEYIRACLESGDPQTAATLEQLRRAENPDTLPLSSIQHFPPYDVAIAQQDFPGYFLLHLERQMARLPNSPVLPLHIARLLLDTPNHRLPALSKQNQALKALACAKKAAALAPAPTPFLLQTLADAEKQAAPYTAPSPRTTR